jgi:CspA family cold shock protein
MSERISGTCKWFNAAKGFGFISRGDGKGDVFVHYSAVEGQGYRQLSEGDQVQFEVTDGDKGPKAINVSKV